MIRINQDDECRMTARERGHWYGLGDVIFAEFECEDRECTIVGRVVRYDSTMGGGRAYFDDHGHPLPSEWYVVAWRPTTDQERADFSEACDRAAAADWHDRRDARAGRHTP